MRKATTTPTMMSGPEPAPDPPVRSTASTTAESGRFRTETTAAPMPTATAGVIEKPGRCEAITPAVAPRNSAGNVGPPRKPPSEMLQAIPLNAIDQRQCGERPGGRVGHQRPQRVLPREQDLVDTLVCGFREGDRQAGDRNPRGGQEDEGSALEDALGLASEPQDQEDAHRASYRQGDRPSEVAHVRAGECGQIKGAERVVASS